MKVYAVGGQVRDELMGLEPKDRDYVVVGSSHEEMMSRGFTQVGASFPVYLHPVTKEEYALARTEISTGPGYHDFEVVFNDHVTIEEDLARRDLTINAIAKDMLTGEYIDPYGGISDIKAGVLRPVSDKTFFEDPLRIYRLARLSARHADLFTISDAALRQCKEAVEGLHHLPKERKVAEIKKCFEDKSCKNKPSVMVEFLTHMGEFPELKALFGIPQPEKHHAEGDPFIHTMMVIDAASNLRGQPEALWAALCHDLGKVCYHTYGNLHGHEEYGVDIAKSLSERFGVPNSWRDLALIVTENHGRMHKLLEMKPKKVYELIKRVKGEKNLEFVENFNIACIADAIGRIPAGEDYPQAFVLHQCLKKLKDNQDVISENCRIFAEKFSGRPDIIRDKVNALKVSYVAEALLEYKLKRKDK